jgi:hypothetical protein
VLVLADTISLLPLLPGSVAYVITTTALLTLGLLSTMAREANTQKPRLSKETGASLFHATWIMGHLDP